jgi:hypothetical protein
MPNKGTSELRNCGTAEPRTNEQTNKRTNEQTNKRTENYGTAEHTPIGYGRSSSEQRPGRRTSKAAAAPLRVRPQYAPTIIERSRGMTDKQANATNHHYGSGTLWVSELLPAGRCRKPGALWAGTVSGERSTPDQSITASGNRR